MKKIKENKKSPSTGLNGTWGTVAMTFLITVAFGIIIYGMYITDFISIIDFSAVIANKREDGNKINNDVVYDILKDETDRYEFVYESTPAELTNIISSFSLPVKYSLKATVMNIWEDDLDVMEISASRNNNSYIIEKSRNNTLFEIVELFEDGNIIVTDANRGKSAKHKNNDLITFESQCGIPTLNDISQICLSIINGNSVVSDFAVSLVSREGVAYYFVSFFYEDINQKEEFYLSTDSGFIYDAFTYIDGTLVYRYHLNEYSA